MTENECSLSNPRALLLPLLKTPIVSTECMMILMLCLHRVHSKLLWGMPLLKVSKSCPKKIFWSWCCQTASLWRRGEERLATFFSSVYLRHRYLRNEFLIFPKLLYRRQYHFVQAKCIPCWFYKYWPYVPKYHFPRCETGI